MNPLEMYVQTLWAFLQTARVGMILNLLGEEKMRMPYLRLRASGTWEITADFPDTLLPSSATEIVIPLVLPLVPIILVAHLETQWVRNQSKLEEKHQFAKGGLAGEEESLLL